MKTKRKATVYSLTRERNSLRRAVDTLNRTNQDLASQLTKAVSEKDCLAQAWKFLHDQAAKQLPEEPHIDSWNSFLDGYYVATKHFVRCGPEPENAIGMVKLLSYQGKIYAAICCGFKSERMGPAMWRVTEDITCKLTPKEARKMARELNRMANRLEKA